MIKGGELVLYLSCLIDVGVVGLDRRESSLSSVYFAVLILDVNAGRPQSCWIDQQFNWPRPAIKSRDKKSACE